MSERHPIDALKEVLAKQNESEQAVRDSLVGNMREALSQPAEIKTTVVDTDAQSTQTEQATDEAVQTDATDAPDSNQDDAPTE